VPYKSEHTVRSYTDGARFFLAWCREQDRPAVLDVPTVTDWVVSLRAAGKSSATMVSRQASVRRFSRWLASRDHIPADLLAGLERPKLDEPLVESLTDDELKRLLATCKGKSLHQVRDRVVLMLMFETGLRASELTGMMLDDVDLDARLAIIRRGKGGKGRLVRFSPQAAAALDDYLHLRRRHPLAGSGVLWLGEGGRKLGYAGLYNMVIKRGKAIGLKKIHPHKMRNTSAVRWLSRGGSVTGLMAQHGWTSVDMARRYIRASEQQLAADEADRLGLGDL